MNVGMMCHQQMVSYASSSNFGGVSVDVQGGGIPLELMLIAMTEGESFAGAAPGGPPMGMGGPPMGMGGPPPPPMFGSPLGPMHMVPPDVFMGCEEFNLPPPPPPAFLLMSMAMGAALDWGSNPFA